MKRPIFVILAGLLLLAGCAPVPAAPTAPAEPAGAAATIAGPEMSQVTPSSLPADHKDRSLTSITLAMGYIPSVQFAPFYVAQERGYFEQVGLAVTYRYGFETDLLKLVGTNELQFVIGSGEEVILGRSQGLPVRYVMRWYRKFPAVLFAKARSGITSPADLAGKTVGVPGLFGANYVGWEALVYATRIDEKRVSLQSIGFTQATAVSQGLVDAAMDYVVNGPVQLRLAGEEVVVLPVSEYIDLPSNGIITNDQTIREKPELVQAMVTALIMGLRDTLDDPDAAFEASLRAVPEAGGEQAAVSRAIFDESLKLWQAADSELGLSDAATWERAAQFMKDMGLIQVDVTAADLFTNEFVAR